jgi:uncharacterized membrane protein YbhN (UPF0104 family)
VSLGVLAVVVAALVAHRDQAVAALREVATLSAGWLAVLVGLALASILANGALVGAITPGLTLPRAVMVQQAATAANNTAIGSGPVSLGVRVAMLRSWRVDDPSIVLAVVALNVLAAYKLWLVTLVTALVGSSGVADDVVDRRIFLAAVAVAVVVLGVTTAWWWLLLARPRMSDWCARRLGGGLQRVRRRLPRLPDVDVPAAVERARTDARALVRARRGRIVAAAVVEQALVVALPIAVVRAFGIGPDVVSTAQVLVTFGLVRLAAALTPIPGGIGVTEVGVTALLVRFGAPEPAVLAAVLTFRTLTFLLPLALGGLCLAAWRRRRVIAARTQAATGCGARDAREVRRAIAGGTR